jgi:hypothetical protein
MRDGIVPTKSEIVSADSKIVLVESKSVLMKSESVSEFWRFNYELIDLN